MHTTSLWVPVHLSDLIIALVFMNLSLDRGLFFLDYFCTYIYLFLKQMTYFCTFFFGNFLLE